MKASQAQDVLGYMRKQEGFPPSADPADRKVFLRKEDLQYNPNPETAFASVVRKPKHPQGVWITRGGFFSNPWINISLLAVIASFAYTATCTNAPLFFAVNILAIIPLAAFLSNATEEIAARVGEQIGGLFNATFGNCAEFAVQMLAILAPPISAIIGDGGARLTVLTAILGLFAGGAGYAIGGVVDFHTTSPVAVFAYVVDVVNYSAYMVFIVRTYRNLYCSDKKGAPIAPQAHKNGTTGDCGGMDIMKDLDSLLSESKCKSFAGVLPQGNQHVPVRSPAMYCGFGAKNTPAFTAFLAAILFFVPLTAAAFTVPSGLRVLTGVGASGTAVAIIPLRTIPDVATTAWIITYVVWAAFFATYLALQLLLIPSEMSFRRKMYLFCVIVAALHFSIGLAQSSTTVADAFTIFGPLIATICTYVMSLAFGGTGTGADTGADTQGWREAMPAVRAMLGS